LLVSWKVCHIKIWDLVNVSKLSQGAEEIVSGHCSMALEERQPEHLGVLGAEVLADSSCQVIVHDIFEIDLIQVIGPWM